MKLCDKCGVTVSCKNFARHARKCSVGGKLPSLQSTKTCSDCGSRITIQNFSRHLKKCSQLAKKRRLNDAPPSTSSVVGDDSERSSATSAHDNVSSAQVSTPALEIREVEKAFRNRMKTYAIVNKCNIKDPALLLECARPLFVNTILEQLQEKNLKVNVVLLTEHSKPNNPTVTKQMNFKTKNVIVLPTTQVEKLIREKEAKILAEMDEFHNSGSGWSLNKVLNVELRINRYVPLSGSTYIDLPGKIKEKKAVINVQNNDQKCFLWSILAALHPHTADRHVERVQHYRPYEHELDEFLQGVHYPVSLDHVKLFEKRSGISINVYSYDEKLVVYPLVVTDEERDTHVDLLYVKGDGNSHYCLIKNLSRLVRAQKTTRHNSIWLCKRCLLHFGKEELLTKHKEFCKEHEPVKIIMPQAGEKIKFKECCRSMRVPFTVYADLECMLTPIQTCTPSKEESFTKKYQKHDAVSFSYYLVGSEEEENAAGPVTYFGEDAAQVFVNKLREESKNLHHLYSTNAALPMELTDEDLIAIGNASHCHICGKEFTEEDPLVRDHDHLTGKFRGPAHNVCNLNFKKPHFLPVFIHNLAGYDTHLFIKCFGLDDETIDVLPNNEERYISFSVNVKGGVQLRFLDSLKFMPSSLENLTKTLNRDQFRHTSMFYTGEQLRLLLKKGVYPYDHMDTLEKFNSSSLPSRADFYNQLNKSDISDEDYEHAEEVWEKFAIKDMKEYTVLYNTSDVLLLADIMENFRNVCMRTYRLDPAWYFTAPGLAWSAMLKTTGVELDLISDYDMILMLTKGIRGGLSQCSHRYTSANNRYMKDYDQSLPASYLMYLDANNLYGWGMSQAMPYGNFEWVADVDSLDVAMINDDADTGYILEVDLEYPKDLHTLHADFPLAPERLTPPGSSQEKLLATVHNKEKYVIHYRNLKLYLSLGLRLKKIHRALSFSQSTWLQPYIDLNTAMRTNAKNDFEKDFYKLMNNSVFGKTMENIRNRVDIRLATREKQVDKWLAQPNFKRRTIFAENLAAVHMNKTKLVFNKPIYVGMSILDVSKTLMYDFHYNVMQARYKESLKLLYTDTDSLLYSVGTDDFYQDMKSMIDKFDTSDFQEDNVYGMPRVNKKVIGKMKDEMNGAVMTEFIALRSKMYATKVQGGENCTKTITTKKAKGVKKSVVENEITFDDYKDCLRSNIDKYCSMNLIRTYRHDLFSVEQNKVALSAQDDKRYILGDGISTLPWGHCKISHGKDDMEVESD